MTVAIVAGIAGGLLACLAVYVSGSRSFGGADLGLFSIFGLFSVLVFLAFFFMIFLGIPSEKIIWISAFGIFALPLSIIDIQTYRLPHILTVPAIFSGLFLSWANVPGGPSGTFRDSLEGCAAGFLVFFLFAFFFPKGLGMGDAFYAGAIGGFIGLGHLPVSVDIASVSALLVVILTSLLTRKKCRIAFGPYLSLSAIAVLLMN